MSYNPKTGKDPYGKPNSIQDDRQIYEDFVLQQKMLRQNYAGAASKTDKSNLHYASKSGFEKFKEQYYEPEQNQKNIYERKLNQMTVPRTRDQYVKNPLTKLLQPRIESIRATKDERFIHDKLDIRDIKGTEVKTYGDKKKFEGRNYMNVTDIEKTTPAQLKQNRITNIPDYKTYVHDIDKPTANKFKTNRETNPLQPVYKVETQSRRHIVALGDIDGNAAKLSKSP